MSEAGEDSQALARIDVRKNGAAPIAPLTEKTAQSHIQSVTRVTLPTFEVVYRVAEGAYQDAQSIRKNNAFELDRELGEEPGVELVLELSLAEIHFSVSLLFRVISGGGGRTQLEWWARRNTDSKLLALWLESLEPHRRQGEFDHSVLNEVRAAAISEAMEIYRRVLSTNPFDVLGLHWTSNEALVKEATSSVLNDLNNRLAVTDVDPQVARYLEPCSDRVTQASEILGSIEGRRAVRSKMVSSRELENARKQAEYILKLADRKGKPGAIFNAKQMLAEVTIA